MSKRNIITVDGLAASGKSTLARVLAERLGFLHLNSGQLYRAIGFLALQEKVDPGDQAELGRILPKHVILLDADSQGRGVVQLDGRDISQLIQEPEVSDATSQAAQFPVVRARLLELQRQAFPGKSLVAEGRDMGTVVFPSAPLKFFVTANEAVRIDRRFNQLLDAAADKSQAAKTALAQKISIEIAERDRRDAERSLAPTVAAPDAVLVDNSADPLDKVVDRMARIARERGL